VQSEDIINAAFVRGALLILLWMVAYLVVRVVSGYWVGRTGDRKAPTFGSIAVGRGGTQVPVGEAVARRGEKR
jgi:hypothetical protein